MHHERISCGLVHMAGKVLLENFEAEGLSWRGSLGISVAAFVLELRHHRGTE